jgi:hypothetical protein
MNLVTRCACTLQKLRKITLLIITGLTIITHAQINTHVLDAKNNPNEPSIALSPTGFNSVAASNINNFYIHPLYKKRTKQTKSSSALGVYGDPVLHYCDTALFFAHLSKTPGKEYGAWFDRIVVQRIINPETWQEKSYSVGYNQDKMQDKPWLSSDNHSPRNKGNVYVTWTEFDQYDSDNPLDKSRIRFSKYMPTADSFSTAITISDSTGDCRDGDNTLEGATTAVGKNGEIYAVWAGHDYIWLDKSYDGGITWNKDRKIATQKNGWEMDMPHIMRANGMPFIVCDTLQDIQYVTWADEENGNADVWLMYSQDQGNTWSNRINLSSDTSNKHQYFPNIAVDRFGAIFVAYYDFRYSENNMFYTTTLSRFEIDKPIREYTLHPTLVPLPGTQVFYGDYLDIDVTSSTLATIYTTNDVNNRTQITLSKAIYYQKTLWMNRQDRFASAAALLNEGDSVSYWCHLQTPASIRYKIKTTDQTNGNVTYKKRVEIEDVNATREIELLTLKLTKNSRIKKGYILIKPYEKGKNEKIRIKKQPRI